MPNHTAAQREKIRTIVLDLYILNVRSSPDICRYLAEKEHITLSERQVQRYIKETTVTLAANATVDRNQLIGTNLARLEDLYKKCIASEKYQTALGVVREISETFGLKAPAKLEHEAGETLHDWLKQAATTWPAEGKPPDGGKPDSGPDPEAVPETNH